jgi:hypothetical protein
MQDLGMFDFEGTCSKFKTLGAKRYIYINDKGYHSTISGLRKDSFESYCDKEKRTTLTPLKRDLW